MRGERNVALRMLYAFVEAHFQMRILVVLLQKIILEGDSQTSFILFDWAKIFACTCIQREIGRLKSLGYFGYEGANLAGFGDLPSLLMD